MSAVLDEETTTVVLDTLDFDALCQATLDHPAEVGLRCRICGHTDLACREHADELRVRLERLVASGIWNAIMCRHCRGEGPTWDAVVEVVDL